MFLRSQNWRTVGGTAINYAAIGGITVGAFALGGPILMGVGAAAMGGLMAASLKAHKDVINDGLAVHPDEHRFSPNLGKIVQNLFRRAELDQHKALIHDFKVDPKNIKERGFLAEIVEEMLGQISDVPNAAAINLEKPTIMISEPLLELLDDHEEEAVIAHELGHIVAEHHSVTLPQKIAGGAVTFSNGLLMIGELMATGVAGAAVTIASGAWARNMFKILHPNGEQIKSIKEQKETDRIAELTGDKPSMREIHESKRTKKLCKAFAQATSASVATLFNPAYLPTLVAVKGLNIGAKYFMASQSQTDEYQADRVAVEIGSSPLSLITALRKMTIIQQRSLKKAWAGEEPAKPGFLKRQWKEAFASHPATNKRIARLASIAKSAGYSEAQIHSAVNDPLLVPDSVNIPTEHIIAMAKSFVGNTKHFASATLNHHDEAAVNSTVVNFAPKPPATGPELCAA